METRQLHIRDLSTVTGIQQYEHEVQSIYFLGLEDFVGTIYLSIESDDYSNEAIPLTSNSFIIGQPMTLYNTTYTCQIYGVLNNGEKIQLSKRFRLIVDKSNTIQGESSEYPIDPNFENSIIEFVTEQKAELNTYTDAQKSEIEATGEAVKDSIPSDYTALSNNVSDLKSEINEITVKEYGVNRFDKTAITTGGYLKSDGTIDPNANWNTSGYCYVGDFEKVNFSKSGVLQSLAYLCIYDEGRNFISQVGSMVSSPYTMPSGTKYIRFSFGTSFDVNTLQVEGGDIFTRYNAYHEPITKVIVDETLTMQGVPADAKAVGERFVNGVKDTVNYSETTLTMNTGKLLNGSNGAITDNSNESYTVSDFVEVNAGSKVMVSAMHFYGQGMYAFYDENKTFISGFSSAQGGTRTTIVNKIVDVPINAKYIVIGNLYDVYTADYLPSLMVGSLSNALASERWRNKKWACLGDSLTAYNGRTKVHYYDYVAQRTGINIVNLGVSGSGYANGSGGNHQIYNKSTEIPTDSDVVTIFGSFNDLSTSLPLGTVDDTDTTTIAGCINKAIDNIQARIPLANIGIVAPTPWSNSQPTTSGGAYNYVEMLKAICARRSIPFLDLWRESNLRPWDADFLTIAYSHDDGAGVHPDENGHKLIASRFKSFLETLLM